jgi:hypothetical protein
LPGRRHVRAARYRPERTIAADPAGRLDLIAACGAVIGPDRWDPVDAVRTGAGSSGDSSAR